MTADAVGALQEVSEAMLTQLFQGMFHTLAVHISTYH
jgi:hypothetical protein